MIISVILSVSLLNNVFAQTDAHKIHATMDKLNYQNSDKPVITIFGYPDSTVDFDVYDSLNQDIFSDHIQISSSGVANYTLDISSYKVGIYSAQVRTLTDRVKMSFGVGLMPTGPIIALNTAKSHYASGEIIEAKGAAAPNSLIYINLDDPSNETEISTKVVCDNAGLFVTYIGIPQNAVNGTWKLEANSRVSYTTVAITVISSNYFTMETKPSPKVVLNETLTKVMTPSHGLLLSPLKQFKSGVKKSDIKCNQDFVLVIKKEGHWPACVNPDTVSKLVLRGWAENPLDELLLRYGNQTQANLVFYEIMNEPKVREWSMMGWKYNSSYASNSEAQEFSATIHLYLPPGIGNHLECENGSYALVMMNLKPVEIEHNYTQVGCNIVSPSNVTNESSMTVKNLNSSSPLQLSLLIDNKYANPEQPIEVDMSLNNTSSNKLILAKDNNWPRSDLSSGSCSNFPFGIAILKGYYTEQNMTGASSLVIYPNLPCPHPPLIKSYTFELLSNKATQECDSLFSCPGSTNMKIHLKIDGFIDNNGQHRPFNVGKYTIIAGDEWGHVTIQHFTEAYGTPLISSENNCGQFYTAPENQRDLKTVPVLLINTNSTGCARLSFAIGYSYNGTVWPRIASFTPILFIGNVHYTTNGNSFSMTPGKDYTNSFKITVIPETVDLANYPVGSKFSVTYIIRSLPNATGFYDQSIPKLVCERYPLAVGFTSDQVNASDFNYIYPLEPPCASGPYQLTGVEISGMNYKWVTLP